MYMFTVGIVVFKIMYIPVWVTLPSAIAIATHWSAVLLGWIIQLTVMECNSLVALGAFSMVIALVTEEAMYNGWTYKEVLYCFSFYHN